MLVQSCVANLDHLIHAILLLRLWLVIFCSGLAPLLFYSACRVERLSSASSRLLVRVAGCGTRIYEVGLELAVFLFISNRAFEFPSGLLDFSEYITPYCIGICCDHERCPHQMIPSRGADIGTIFMWRKQQQQQQQHEQQQQQRR